MLEIGIHLEHNAAVFYREAAGAAESQQQRSLLSHLANTAGEYIRSLIELH